MRGVFRIAYRTPKAGRPETLARMPLISACETLLLRNPNVSSLATGAVRSNCLRQRIIRAF